MSLFSEVIRDNTDTSCILLCGPCEDQIISADLVLREFSVTLADFLREQGYDNIVFYDCTNAMGAYVYDEKSAQYCFPNSASAAPTTSSAVPTFGRPRTPVAQTQTAASVEPTANGTIYQRKHLLETEFYQLCQKFMTGTEYRSAVVITNVNNLMRNDNTMRRYVESILHNWHGRNLMIFLQPNINEDNGNTFYNNLGDFGLLHYFYRDHKPKAGRVFSIRCFGKDEIRYLLKRHITLNQLTVPDGIDVVSDKMAYAIRSLNAEPNRAEITLRSLNKKIADQLTTSTCADDDFIGRVLGCDMHRFDFSPWDTLNNRRGWEGITEQLRQLLKGLDKPTNVSALYSCELSLLVERLGKDDPVPLLSSPHLPHLMIEGNPGTGKTTIVRSLGRIMHDEGILSIGHVVVAKKSDLVSDVIGGTAIKVQRILDQAENGILFVDEAYALCEAFDENGNGADFAKEAVDALVQALTDESRHVVMVFAGYYCSDENATDGVRGLYKMNAGLESRIKLTLSIPDYTPDILTDIFFDTLYRHGFELSDDLNRKNILNYMENAYQSRNRKTFANGRFVNEYLIETVLIPAAKSRESDRIARCDFGEEATKLDKADVESVLREMKNYPVLGDLGEIIVKECLDYHGMLRDGGRISDSKSGLQHMVLYGNRGTGKETLVDLICRALSAASLISNVEPVKIQSPDAISQQELEKCIRNAVDSNTVLFIKNAQTCRAESSRAICEAMGKHPELVCVFSVLENSKKDFIDNCSDIVGQCRSYTIPEYTGKQLMQIFEKLLEKEGHSCSEDCKQDLKILFDNWYSNRSTQEGYANVEWIERLLGDLELRSYQRTHNVCEPLIQEDIPTEYQNVVKAMSHSTNVDEILGELDQYTGWEDLKKYIKRKYTEIQYSKVNPKVSVSNGHLLFVGQPGTGKTTAAKYFATACYAMGLISSSCFVSCTARNLIAGYVGQTKEQTAKLLESGRNGVIFIDEAYDLSYMRGRSGDSFKEEAVTELLSFLEKEHETTIVILAGYENLMDEFLRSNPGLASRFTNKVRFPNFEPAECVSILQSSLIKVATLEDQALEEAAKKFVRYCSLENFGNARDVRNIAEKIIANHSDRFLAMPESDQEDVFTADDVKAGFEEWEASR